jgi:hypothetical protein
MVATPARFEWTAIYFKELAILGTSGYGTDHHERAVRAQDADANLERAGGRHGRTWARFSPQILARICQCAGNARC